MEKNGFIQSFVNTSVYSLLSNTATGTLRQDDKIFLMQMWSGKQCNPVLLSSAPGILGAQGILNHKPCNKSLPQLAAAYRFTRRAPGSLGR